MTPLLARIGLPPPSFVRTLIAWLLASNPLGLFLSFIGGPVSPSALYHTLGWMCGLQLAGGACLILAAIARLRSAFRANAGGDGGALAAASRARPGDSGPGPLWATIPSSGEKCIPAAEDSSASWSASSSGSASWPRSVTPPSSSHAVPSSSSGITATPAVAATAERPELNLIVRFFLEESGPNVPVDAARIDFNLFLRFATCTILFMISLMAAGIAAEVITTERAKDTWSSLIATPLSRAISSRKAAGVDLAAPRDLHHPRLALGAGTALGAVHPLGFLAAMLVTAASIGFYLLFGLMTAVQAKDPATATTGTLGLSFLPVTSAALPYLLPAGIGSAFFGVASSPFVAWLSLVSYRELRCAITLSVYPAFQWMKLDSDGGLLLAALTCAVGILAPASAPGGCGAIASRTSIAGSAGPGRLPLQKPSKRSRPCPPPPSETRRARFL